jgi:hypothetical protein
VCKTLIIFNDFGGLSGIFDVEKEDTVFDHGGRVFVFGVLVMHCSNVKGRGRNRATIVAHLALSNNVDSRDFTHN